MRVLPLTDLCLLPYGAMGFFIFNLSKMKPSHLQNIGPLKWSRCHEKGTSVREKGFVCKCKGEYLWIAFRYVAFSCGLIRGALANLNIPSLVTCTIESMPAAKFNIHIQQKNA